jgi:hypothetical protein
LLKIVIHSIFHYYGVKGKKSQASFSSCFFNHFALIFLFKDCFIFIFLFYIKSTIGASYFFVIITAYKMIYEIPNTKYQIRNLCPTTFFKDF